MENRWLLLDNKLGYYVGNNEYSNDILEAKKFKSRRYIKTLVDNIPTALCELKMVKISFEITYKVDIIEEISLDNKDKFFYNDSTGKIFFKDEKGKRTTY